MRRRATAPLLLVASVVTVAVLISALLPASAFRAQASGGSAVYTQNCLSCHGGAGGPGVPGKTEPLEGARFVSRNPTALEIFDVVRSGREGSLRALTDDQLWAAIAAELAANGVDLGSVRLGPGTSGALTTPTGSINRNQLSPPGR